MNQNLEILLYGDVVNTSSIFSAQTNTNVIGKLYVESGTVSLSYSINDVKNLGGINSSFSRTFDVVGSKEVNQLLGHIFDVSSTYTYFNQNKKVKAKVFESGNVVLEGYFQITSIITDKQKIKYQCVIYGDNDNLLKNIGDVYLTGLDLSDSTHTYTASTIVSSWTTGNTLPFYYPLLDNGNNFDYDDINGTNNQLRINDFKPATNLHYLLRKIFAYAGKTFSSNILNSQRWRNVIIPFYGSQLEFASDVINERKINVGLGTTFSALTTGGSIQEYIMPLSVDNVPPFYDVGNKWDSTNYYYTADGYYTISASFEGKFRVYQTSGATFGYFWLRDASTLQVLTQPVCFAVGQSQVIVPTLSLGSVNVVPGQKVEIILHWYMTPPPAPGLRLFEIFDSYVVNGNTYYTQFKITAQPQILAGSQISLSDSLPKNIKAIDVLKSVAAAANLYIEPNPNIDNDYIVESRNDYYLSGTTLDWTEKLDSSKPVVSSLLSDYLSREILLTYKKDTDFYNSDYSTRAEDEIFGEKRIDVNNDFLKSGEKKKIELIFAPTPVTLLNGNNEIVIPKLGKQDENLQWKSADSVIRLLQKPHEGKIHLSGSSIQFEGVGYKYYPYAGMLDKPFAGDNFDLCFDKARYYYYPRSGNTITVNNLYNSYWSNYFDEITSPNSRIYTAYFKLNSQDISNFRFWNTIYIEQNGSGSKFYVNKIIDYKPGLNQSTKVELIKILNVPQSTKSVKIKERPKNPIIIGGNDIQGKSVSITGENNRTGTNSNMNSIVGNQNYIDYNSRFNFITGSGNTLYGQSVFNTILGGQNNIIPAGSTGNTIIGSSNSSINNGITGTTIIGLNNYTGLSSNTVYVPSLTVLSGLTVIGGITGLQIEQYWKSGSTGTQSLLRNYSSGNTAVGNFGLTAGGTGNTNVGKFSSIINGLNNSISDFNFQSIFNGVNNTASNHYTTILNGKNNNASGVGATIIGTYCTASGTYSFNVGGNNTTSGLLATAIGKLNKAGGNYSFVVGGLNTGNTTLAIVFGYRNISVGTITGGLGNRGMARESIISQGLYNSITNVNAYSATIVNGRYNSNNSYFGFIANGHSNYAGSSATFSTILNGRVNSISGQSRFSTIITGSGNSISDAISTSITSGNDIIATLSATTYAKNLKHSGAIYHKNITITTDYICSNEDYLIFASGNSVSTIWLPASPPDGQELVIKANGATSSNNIDIQGNGKDLDGSGSFLLDTDWQVIHLVYSSSGYWLFV